MEGGGGSLFQRSALPSDTTAGDASAALRPRTSAVTTGSEKPPAAAVARSKSQLGITPSTTSTSSSLPSASSSAAIVPSGVLDPLRPYLNVDSVVPLSSVVKARRIRLDILSTWGDVYYVGLAGVEVLVAEPLKAGATTAVVRRQALTLDMMSAEPRDINQDGYFGDKRTLDKVIDGVNVTTDDLHMWLIPFTPNASHTLDIDLGSSRAVYGVSVASREVPCAS